MLLCSNESFEKPFSHRVYQSKESHALLHSFSPSQTVLTHPTRSVIPSFTIRFYKNKLGVISSKIAFSILVFIAMEKTRGVPFILLSRIFCIVLLCFPPLVPAASSGLLMEPFHSVPSDNNKHSNNISFVHAANEPAEVRDSHGHGKGYGHGGGGYGHGHGAITLDPVSIISLLALGAFLINNILQLLRANAPTGSGRSLDVMDLNVPLDLSDFASSGILNMPNDQKKHMRRANGNKGEDSDGGPSFSQFFENVGSLYYLHPKKRNICIKKVVCNYVNAQQAREEQPSSLKTRIFDLMLSTITRFVAPEIKEDQGKQSEICHKFHKLCSDSLLQDAKISAENKVYSQVTSFISSFAFSRLLSSAG